MLPLLTQELHTLSDLPTLSERNLSRQHRAALLLASCGFRVFPLNGKIPIFKGYQTDATTKEEKINWWWYQRPFSNIGGMVFQGHVVIDIDPRNGGDDTWGRLNEGFALPPTLTARTSRGGRHLWFKLPYDLPPRGQAGPGIDLKNSRQFTVLPGSVHERTGDLYRWGTVKPVAMLPDHLIRTVLRLPTKPKKRAPSSAQRGGSGLLRTLADAREGERNSTLFWASCRAYENGLDIDDDLTDVALNLGLELSEIEGTLQSAQITVLGVNR